ncbi:interleukin-17 receptor A-like isoform X2 [Ptychodera flava]|uniref:interleukin-17 receptor A-like isoform X2 n=1 Tax=Ptychodera flava TaxID=63121 RepID=UPI003969F693
MYKQPDEETMYPELQSTGDITSAYIGCSAIQYFEPVSLDALPSQPDDVNVSVYQYSDDSKLYPALNITVVVDLKTGSSNLKGIKFILRGVTNNDFDYSLFNKEICRTYDMSSADTRWREGGPSTVLFYYDCFKLSPSSTYYVEVILLPVAGNGERKSVTEQINTPTCSEVPEFYECPSRQDASIWGPSNYMIRTVYDTVYLSFNLPPPELHLNRFKVVLYKGYDIISNHVIKITSALENNIMGRPINEHALIFNGSMVTSIFYNVTPGEHMLKVQPIPIPPSVCDPPNECIVTSFPNFMVVADPCKPNPCGHHGNCSSFEENYNCTCDGDSYDANGTCIVYGYKKSFDDDNIDFLWIFVVAGIVCALILVYVMKRMHGKLKQQRDEHQLIPVPSPYSPVVIHPESPHVLVVYSKDCSQYNHLVEATCEVLRRQLGCDVTSDFWESGEIARKGLAPWLTDKLRKSSKILFLASKGSRIEWESMCSESREVNTNNGMFRVAMDFISGDAAEGVHSKRRGKYVCAHFPFSSACDVPDVLRNFGRPNVYALPRQLKSLYFELMGLQEKEADVRRSDINQDIDNRLSNTEEGRAWQTSIDVMTSYDSAYPSWYEDLHGSSPNFQVGRDSDIDGEEKEPLNLSNGPEYFEV